MDTYHGKNDLARQERMVELYRNGLTLEQVGDLYGLTRQRVQQIITSAGVKATEGGAVVKRALRAAERKRRKNQKAA